MEKNSTLPKFLHQYFWDVEVKKINPQKKSQFIIQRLLEMGDLKVVRWLIRNFQRSEIKKTIKNRRGFSPKTVNFWSLFFKIPQNKIACLRKPYLQQHAIHWPH